MLDLKTPPVALLDGLDDILIGPVPVGALPVAHHLPHHDTEAPGVLENRTSIESHISTEKQGVRLPIYNSKKKTQWNGESQNDKELACQSLIGTGCDNRNANI